MDFKDFILDFIVKAFDFKGYFVEDFINYFMGFILMDFNCLGSWVFKHYHCFMDNSN